MSRLWAIQLSKLKNAVNHPRDKSAVVAIVVIAINVVVAIPIRVTEHRLSEPAIACSIYKSCQ